VSLAGTRRARLISAALGALLGAALPAAAEIQLEGVRWELRTREQVKANVSSTINTLTIGPGGVLPGRLIASVKFFNRGPKTEGVLLRYSLTAKLDRVKEDGQEPIWAVPFLTDEQKRLPKVAANQKDQETQLDPTALVQLYLNRVHRAGFWPVELKIQVMVEPKKGLFHPLQILEATLPVVQK
jgi:hypothetical protein